MSLFKRPAWVKSQTQESKDADENLFSHSERSYRDIVAEQERNKRQKLERKQAKQKRLSSDRDDKDKEGKVKDEPSRAGSLKRRRITPQDSEALLGSLGLSAKVTAAPAEEWSPVIIDDESPVRRSPRINRHDDYDSPRKPRRGPQIIELDDKDNEEEADEDIFYEAPPPAASVEPVDESDDEFAELARKARRERMQNEMLGKKSHTPDVRATSPNGARNEWETDGHRSSTPPPDPVVQILVSSRLPNTDPLIVHRKLSQRIKEIRQAWCSKQGFSDDMTRNVFFIHRMRKIYDATTCRSLGLDVNAAGEIVMKGAEDNEGADKVHLEAVTEELFAQMKAERAMEAQRRSGELLAADDAQTGAEEAEEEVKSNIRLILKAKIQKDFKMLVKPHTQFSKIVSAYRKSHSLDESAVIYLEFDGDRLEPDDEVQSTDIGDRDILNVHIS